LGHYLHRRNAMILDGLQLRLGKMIGTKNKAASLAASANS
jgi:hypothetical protein